MNTRTERIQLAPAMGGGLWFYCEKDYEAPHSIILEVSTTSAPGIDPASRPAGVIVKCDYCGATQELR